jgi:hypothetical protein
MENVGLLLFLIVALAPPVFLYRVCGGTLLESCLLGWIPGNIVVCIHVGMDTHSLYNGVIVFIFMSVCQFVFVKIIYDYLKGV